MKTYKNKLYTTLLLTAVTIFTLGCTGHNYSNYTDTNSSTPPVDTSKGYHKVHNDWDPFYYDWTNSQ
jgi:hypothetical protein